LKIFYKKRLQNILITDQLNGLSNIVGPIL